MISVDPWVIKLIAAAVAVVTAYVSDGGALRRMLNRFRTRAGREHAQRTNMDRAWRELMDDSIERKCRRSVDLLNEWMQCRTTDGLPKDSSGHSPQVLR